MTLWIEKNRRPLGMTLVVGGLVPFVALMIYIVAQGKANIPLMIATLSCWVLVFLGKTLLKTQVPATVHD